MQVVGRDGSTRERWWRGVHEQAEAGHVPVGPAEVARPCGLLEAVGVGSLYQQRARSGLPAHRGETVRRRRVAVGIDAQIGWEDSDLRVGEGDPAGPAGIGVEPSDAGSVHGAGQRLDIPVRDDPGPGGIVRIDEELANAPAPERFVAELRDPEEAGRGRGDPELHPPAPHPVHGPAG